MSDPIWVRKAEHLDLAQRMPDDASGAAGWSDIHLVHQALPSIDADRVDTAAVLFGRQLSLPLVIAGMTGGHPGAVQINRFLARAAEKVGVALGVGSQRAALEHPELTESYTVIREEAPNALVLGNIGIGQLIRYFEEGHIERYVASLIEMVGADALAVHLNYLEEVVQPEGQTRARGALNALAAFVDASPVPVVAKETGGGLSIEVARTLKDIGVSALDVGGRGGTSFAAIEAERSRVRGDERRSELGAALANWGIPTAVSVRSCSDVLPTIAVGGVRSGVDAAKSIALGAVAAGVGRPLLVCASESEDAVLAWLDGFRLQLRSAMFLAGAERVSDLTSSSRVVLGTTGEWFRQLGLT
ncbi:MAG TPA: type 2 isopentenyl-diphosphate Delta-isomerase [Acidimicrobiales bacterium]